MTKPFAATYPVKKAKDRIIVALDVPTAAEARSIVSELGDIVGAFKIGSQLFTTAGPEFVREIVHAGHRVFLDLKFHDIPNTVANAGLEAARLGVWMFNVHASGGGEMIRQTVDAVTSACEKESLPRPLMIGVTVLTSSDASTLAEIGVGANAEEQVLRLAKLAAENGLDGVVASAREAAAIRSSIRREDFSIVTPGIRPSVGTSDDQKRVTTVAEAFANGSTYVVIGRPVLNAADRAAAARSFVEEAEKTI